MVLVISKQPFVFMWWIIDVQESKDLHGHIYINHTWEIIIMLCMPFLEHVFVYYLSRGWMYPEHVHIYDRRDGQCSVRLHGRHGHERRLMSVVVFFNPLRPSLFYFILFYFQVVIFDVNLDQLGRKGWISSHSWKKKKRLRGKRLDFT
jgi:hypothetical protein